MKVVLWRIALKIWSSSLPPKNQLLSVRQVSTQSSVNGGLLVGRVEFGGLSPSRVLLDGRCGLGGSREESYLTSHDFATKTDVNEHGPLLEV